MNRSAGELVAREVAESYDGCYATARGARVDALLDHHQGVG